jgi:hypothetical protein
MRSDLARLVRRGALLAALLGCAGGAPASAEPVAEHELKAAFVFNFTVFTEWPQEVLAAGAPIRVCASAAGPLAAALVPLGDKLVNGHRIAIVRPVPANVRSCHVLVLAGPERERWPQLRRELAGAHVLTVSDDSASGTAGAVIGLSVENQRIGFDVDMGAARSARLNLSSKLLRLARSVQ